MDQFKYLWLTVQSNGLCTKVVKKKEQAGWSRWRLVSGFICDICDSTNHTLSPMRCGLRSMTLTKRY